MVPLVGADGFDPVASHLVGGVVDDQVEPSEFRKRSLDDLLAVPLLSNVAGHGDARATALAHHARRFRGVVVLVQIRDQHVGTFARESQRHGATNAAVAAGDDRLLAQQPLRAAVRVFAEIRPRLHVRVSARIGLGLLRVGWLGASFSRIGALLLNSHRRR